MAKLRAGRRDAKRFHSVMLEQRCAHLTHEAARLMLVNGCDVLRVDDVAQASGVSKGTCYQHFASRNAMLTAAQTCLDQHVAQHLSASAEAGVEVMVVQAIDRVTRTLELRRSQPRSIDLRTADGWPCCLKHTDCPVGGPSASLTVLRGVVRKSGYRTTLPVDLALDLVLAIPISRFAEATRAGQQPTLDLETVRAAARDAFEHLFQSPPAHRSNRSKRQSRSTGDGPARPRRAKRKASR